MILLKGADVTTFSLPEDGHEAMQAFLAILHNPHETYLEMYGDTLVDLYQEIKEADANGITVHVLLDHTQSCGPTEQALVADLVANLKQSDVTITTAGPDAEKKSQIAHRKRIFDAVTCSVAFGSVNASRDGFLSQTNDMVTFQSPEYVIEAIRRFEARKVWAREHLAHAQVQP